MHQLLLLGLNHNTAPLELRERLAFGHEQARQAVVDLRQRHPDTEFVLLSTCNRVELYAARAGTPDADALAADLARLRGVPEDAFRSHTYTHRGHDAVRHLFHVVCSLDSMVLGETQILGQVRAAYETASAGGAAGALLNPLFQRAAAVGKQVMSQTKLNEGRVSVASVAVDLARQIFENFADKTILTVGVGKMTRLVLTSFKELHAGRLLIANRDASKAMALAEKFGGQASGLDALDEQLVAADIVITSTGATEPIITAKQFNKLRKARRFRPIFLIDLAVPRDVEAAVGEIENVFLYNLDDLQQVVRNTMATRGDAVEAARKIVEEHVEQFGQWHRQRTLGPVIDRLYTKYHDLARAELDKTLARLPNVSDEEREHLRELTRRIVNKLLHEPIRNLRHADQHTGAQQPYLHALERLFGLGEGKDGTTEGAGGTEGTNEGMRG
jgi:glutamyl-tRNA reductase